MTDTNRDFSPAEYVRIHEANCQIQFPTADEQNFRIAMMKHIARKIGLAELKTAVLTGTGQGVQRPKGGEK